MATKMSQTTESTNKALVLEAFDTLSNKRDYAAAGAFGQPIISSTALTSRQAEMACSI
jgi:hypothetical protein